MATTIIVEKTAKKYKSMIALCRLSYIVAIMGFCWDFYAAAESSQTVEVSSWPIITFAVTLAVHTITKILIWWDHS